jgi:hypothetical protein
VRNEFSAASIEKTVTEAEAKLGQIYKELYQRTTDFGGHPNERGVSSNMKLEESANKKEFLQIYLHAELYILGYFEEVARAGFCCLHIFQHIFKERFSILGLKDRLFALREFEQPFRTWLRGRTIATSSKGKVKDTTRRAARGGSKPEFPFRTYLMQQKRGVNSVPWFSGKSLTSHCLQHTSLCDPNERGTAIVRLRLQSSKKDGTFDRIIVCETP